MSFFEHIYYLLPWFFVGIVHAGGSGNLLIVQEQPVEKVLKAHTTQFHPPKSILLNGVASTISGISFAKKSLVTQTADKLALPIEIVLWYYQSLRPSFKDRLTTFTGNSAQQARFLVAFLASCREVTYYQFLMKDANNFRSCNRGDVELLCKNFRLDFARIGSDGDWLRTPLKNYVKALCAVNRAAYMGMYARLHNNGYGPSYELRMLLKNQIQHLHEQFFLEAFVLPQKLSSIIQTKMPRAIEGCLKSVALTPERLALHDKESVTIDTFCDDDERSLSSIAGYDEDDEPDSVKLSDRFSCISADSLISYENIGTCLRFPSDLQALLPNVPMFHFIANQQGGPTCAYHAAANAQALKVLIQKGKFPSAAGVRHEAQRYICAMQSVYDCRDDHSLSIKRFEEVVKDPYDFHYYRTKNGDPVFLSVEKKQISHQEADLSLQKLLDTVFTCKQRVVTCGCTVRKQGADLCHAVLCALVKPYNKRLMFVYMDSNNVSLDRSESYSADARGQVTMLVKAIKSRMDYRCSI